MKITQCNGNHRNQIKGSRLSFWDKKGNLVEQFIVPAHNAKKYCLDHPSGYYGQLYKNAEAKARGTKC